MARGWLGLARAFPWAGPATCWPRSGQWRTGCTARERFHALLAAGRRPSEAAAGRAATYAPRGSRAATGPPSGSREGTEPGRRADRERAPRAGPSRFDSSSRRGEADTRVRAAVPAMLRPPPRPRRRPAGPRPGPHPRGPGGSRPEALVQVSATHFCVENPSLHPVLVVVGLEGHGSVGTGPRTRRTHRLPAPRHRAGPLVPRRDGPTGPPLDRGCSPGAARHLRHPLRGRDLGRLGVRGREFRAGSPLPPGHPPGDPRRTCRRSSGQDLPPARARALPTGGRQTDGSRGR